MKRSHKIFIFTGICIAIAAAIYFIFYYKKSAYQLAADLNLYTGITGEDQLLDNMINQALTGGGTIGSNNLEWELNDAAQRYTQRNVSTVFTANGKIIPASALLATIDITHDYYNGSPDVPGSAAQLTQANVDRFDEILRDEPTWTPEEAAAYYSADLGQEYTAAEFEEARALLSADIKPGDAYIAQQSLNVLWELLRDYNAIANVQGIIK